MIVESIQPELNFNQDAEVLTAPDENPEANLSEAAKQLLSEAREKAEQYAHKGIASDRARKLLGFGRSMAHLRGTGEITEADVATLILLHPLPLIDEQKTSVMVADGGLARTRLQGWARRQHEINGDDGDARQRAANDI